MRTDEEALRTCPTCGTPVDEARAIGLRDYRWLSDLLPGRVGPMDIDAVVHQARSGRLLVFEFKAPRESLGLGVRLTLAHLVRAGADVWVTWGPYNDGTYDVGSMDRYGQVVFVQRMELEGLRKRVREWWARGAGEMQVVS